MQQNRASLFPVWELWHTLDKYFVQAPQWTTSPYELMNSVEIFLEELRQNKDTIWLATEIDKTISQGISRNAEEAVSDSLFFKLVPFDYGSKVERNKRKKYETSRSLTEAEKIEVILDALKILFLDFPAISYSALKNLQEVDSKINAIKLSIKTDDQDVANFPSRIDIKEFSSKVSECERAYIDFKDELDK